MKVEVTQLYLTLCGPMDYAIHARQETPVRFLGWEDSPGEGKGYPLQYSGLENYMDCIVHGAAKSQIQLSDFHLHSLWFSAN